jgi:CYTH domain-containing protein
VTSFKYAHVERERRWLLASVPNLPEHAWTRRIVDRYVTGTRLRLREVTEADGAVVRKLGHKVRVGEGAHEVAHTSLYLDDGEWDVLVALPARTLTKTRTLVPHGDHTVAVDVHADGTVIAEVDAGEGPTTELPAGWAVVREVTDEEDYTGGALAR